MSFGRITARTIAKYVLHALASSSSAQMEENKFGRPDTVSTDVLTPANHVR